MNQNRFLKDFHEVLTHHVNCVLKSGMILDEDMSLLTTLWDPKFYQGTMQFDRRLLLTSAGLTTLGLATTVKLNSIYPFFISVLPMTVRLMSLSIVCYRRRQYKRRFERLLRLIKSTYSISKEIAQYYRKRDAAVKSHKLQVNAFNILVQPGEEFLKFAVNSLHEIVDQIRNCMVQVCQSVPITEGDFIASIQWNLDDLLVTTDLGFKEVQARFDKLSDLFLLITSNFLSCIGLSCCVQLWRERCDVPHVLDCLLPELVSKLDGLLNEIRAQFNRIRFNLCDGVIDNEGSVVRSSRLERPIMDLLLSLQIAFETARRLQVLEAEGRMEECVTILDDVNKQMEESRDMLSILIARLLSARQKPIPLKPPMEIVPPADDQIEIVDGNEADRELEDEEYNLSIHGSEPDDPLYLPNDGCSHNSVENLNVVLLELKNKLLQDEGKVGKQAREELNRGDVVKSVPADEPSPRLPMIPDIGDIGGLVQAITFTARKLNRSEEFQFGFNMFPEIPRPFNTTYKCFSVAMLPGNERQDVEKGGKIIMPPSALEQLTRLNINYPMQFKIVNKNTNRTSHCGVLEFVADEGKVYLPLWMMHNLVLEENDSIQIESVSLPVGTFAKFQPLSPEFLDITNPKAVLENCLRTFSCLTSGDVIAVQYNQRVYELCVLETQPGKAISIIECDMNVEFAAPVGYKETEEVKPPEEDMAVDPADLMPESAGFVAFGGTGNRLDGKRRKDSGSMDAANTKPAYKRGIPDYDYKVGTLRFMRMIPKSDDNSKEESEEFKAFSGEGFSLRRRD